MTKRRGWAPERMEGQRPWARRPQDASGDSEPSDQETRERPLRNVWEGAEDAAKTPSRPVRTPPPAPAAEGRRRLPSGLSAGARWERRARRAPRPAPGCPSQLRALARPCAPGPPQPLSRLIPQLFKSRTVSSPFAQEAGAPFPDERRRSDTPLTAKPARGLHAGSRLRICRSGPGPSVCPARGPPPSPGIVRSQLGARANEGGGAPRPPAGARVCGVWARGRRWRGRHKCAGRARRAPEAAAEAAPGSTGRVRGAARGTS